MTGQGLTQEGSEAEMGDSGETETERENGERTGQMRWVGRGRGPAQAAHRGRSRRRWSDRPGLPRARGVEEEPG